MFQIEKKLFFECKNKILTHAFGQKMPNFSLFGFGQNKTRKNAITNYNFVEKQ